ncbi:MAG: VWA domain-containing protein [Gemmataceae bacterium]|nr:VWA domain-containing protein [Gemmataceae bacterium]
MLSRALLAGLALLGLQGNSFGFQEKKAPEKPSVEVVFCLDTTGSMGGLIQAAKQKIWSISNQIAGGNPVPHLKIGLLAYRDKNDAYITKTYPLTDDLDAIHAQLKEFQAAGGGDGPEAVNQALNESITKFQWSADKKTLRIIFLVGDAPPHMDYNDDVKYTETCRLACEKGIIINSIQCGSNGECEKHWKEICFKAEGSYVRIAQNGGAVQTVSTPFDARLAAINGELAEKTLAFGSVASQADGARKNRAAAALAPGAAAERAAFQAKNQQAASYDLLDSIKKGTVKLEALKEEELPKELRELKPEQRKEYLAKLDQKRADLNKEAIDLDKKRSDFIAKKQNEEAGKTKSGFDSQVQEVIRNQAKKFNINY